MHLTSETEMLTVTGGAKYGLLFGILAIGAMVVGIVDGFLRPKKCN